MKLAVLAAFLLSTTVLSVAQTMHIECGYVDLRLDEPEKEVIQALTEAGYVPVDLDSHKSQLQMLFNKSTKDSCDVAFSKGRLAYAARRWSKNISSELDAMRNVVAALQSITKVNQHNSCDVFSYQRSVPADETKSVSILCDGHTVALESGTLNGNPMYDIEEGIGIFPH
jgi:hypothetical protein